MNIDTGHIKLWNDLTAEERESGRWVKLGDDEFARALTIEEHKRTQQLGKIFGEPQPYRAPDKGFHR